ncbi:MAG: hypothetical protein U0790_21045 [Isosphaeraceae bacterium]
MRPAWGRCLLRVVLASAAMLTCIVLPLWLLRLAVRIGSPPEFGVTAYPMLSVVHWADPGDSIPPGKLPPRDIRAIRPGMLVTWADGTRTVYLHRSPSH